MKALTIIANNHVTGIEYGTIEIFQHVCTIPYQKTPIKKSKNTNSKRTEHKNIRSNTYKTPKKTINLIPIEKAIEIRVLYQIKSPVAKYDAEIHYKKLLKKQAHKRLRKFILPEDQEVINEAMAKTHQLRLQYEENILKQQQIKSAWEQYQK